MQIKSVVVYLVLLCLLTFACTQPPVIEKFGGRRSVPLGSETKIYWKIPKATEVEIEGISETFPSDGSIHLKPQKNQTYKLLAKRKGKVIAEKEFEITVYKRDAKIDYFHTRDQEISNGEEATLSWKVSNANRIRIEGVADSLLEKGEIQVKPEKSTTYYLFAEDQYGGKVQDSLHVEVIFKANIHSPKNMLAGNTNEVKWNIEGAKRVWIAQEDGSPLPDCSECDSLPAQGSIAIKPLKTFVCVLFFELIDGSKGKREIYIDVQPAEFKGTRKIMKGESAKLNWKTGTNIKEIEILELHQKNLPQNGTVNVSPRKSTTYHLKVTDQAGEVEVLEHKVNVQSRAYVKDTLSIAQKARNSHIDMEIFKVDRSNYPNEVKLYVLATDKEGNFMNNLAKDATTARRYFLNLTESVAGKTRQIRGFEVSEHHKRLSEYALGLSLDYSGSMAGVTQYLEKSVQDFVRNKYPEDLISIVKFDEKIATEARASLSAEDIKKNVTWDGLTRFGGYTALYAGADQGLESIKHSKKEKTLLLFTDGMENSSFIYYGKRAVTASELAKNARENNIRIFPIAFGDGVNDKLLNELADLTDGKAYFLSETKEIAEVYQEFPRVFENYYVISYKPTAAEGKHEINLTYDNTLRRKEKTRIGFLIGDSISIDKLEISEPSSTGMRVVAPPQAVAFFDFDRAELLEQYKNNMQPFIAFLKNNPQAKIEIHGHTDQVGSPQSCQALSERRANTVSAYLQQQGIAADRILIKGFGKTRPLWQLEDEEWKAHENRRIEALLLMP